MKVAVINDGYPVSPVHSGPIAQTIYDTAIAIRNPEMVIISPWANELEGMEVSPNGTFHHVDIDSQTASLEATFRDRLPRGLRDPAERRRLAYFRGIVALLKTIKPDVIQTHNGPGMVPGISKRFRGVPLILFLHNHLDRLRPALFAADHVVLVSNAMRARIVQACPECHTKISIIPNGVDTGKWHPDRKHDPETGRIRKKFGLIPGRTVLFVGRIVQEKGIAQLVDAIDLVRRKIPEVKLLIVGGPVHGGWKKRRFSEDLVRRASRMGGSVVFSGYVDQDRVPCHFAAADVAVVPSLWEEPFGKVVIEAMASGLPVIGSRSGAIPEIVGASENGILLDNAQDPKEAADRIMKVS